MAICMDINPHKFEAPWEAYELANHCLKEKVQVQPWVVWLPPASATAGSGGCQPSGGPCDRKPTCAAPT